MSNKPVSEAAVHEAIGAFKIPETGRSVSQLGQIHEWNSMAGTCRLRWV